jgi:hypothetical protein
MQRLLRSILLAAIFFGFIIALGHIACCDIMIVNGISIIFNEWRHNLEHHLRLSIMLLESSIMLLELSIMLLENI